LNPNDSWEKNIGRTYWMFQAKRRLAEFESRFGNTNEMETRIDVVN